ncbi:MAG: hypothetical protein WC350_03845 [Candidatus Micrarchaeia archaeon]
MTKVFLLGTSHISSLRTSFKEMLIREKIQAIFSEAVQIKGHFTFDNLILEPFFVIFSFIWLHLPISHQDSKSIFNLSKDSGIDYYDSIDLSISDLVRISHAPMNYLTATLILIIIFYTLSIFFGSLNMLFPVLLLVVILLTSMVYSFFFVIRKTARSRNEAMVSKSVSIINEKSYDRVIFSCGIAHMSDISKRFKQLGYEVEELSGYQHPAFKRFYGWIGINER